MVGTDSRGNHFDGEMVVQTLSAHELRTTVLTLVLLTPLAPAVLDHVAGMAAGTTFLPVNHHQRVSCVSFTAGPAPRVVYLITNYHAIFKQLCPGFGLSPSWVRRVPLFTHVSGKTRGGLSAPHWKHQQDRVGRYGVMSLDDVKLLRRR